MPMSHMHRQIEQRLVDHDVRYTTGRREVVEALDTADGPPVGTYQARTAAVPFAGHGSLFMRIRIREIMP